MRISKEVFDILKRHPWPGNIRELRNLCEYLTILRIRRVIEVKDLPDGHLEIFNEPDFIYCFKLPESGLVWHELEVDLIQQALAKTKGNFKEAAQLLGISRDTLCYRIRKYGLTSV